MKLRYVAFVVCILPILSSCFDSTRFRGDPEGQAAFDYFNDLHTTMLAVATVRVYGEPEKLNRYFCNSLHGVKAAELISKIKQTDAVHGLKEFLSPDRQQLMQDAGAQHLGQFRKITSVTVNYKVSYEQAALQPIKKASPVQPWRFQYENQRWCIKSIEF